MARKKVGRPKGSGTESTVLSLRLPPAMRQMLEAGAQKRGRKLSAEIKFRLEGSFGRYKVDEPAHLRRLADLVLLAARDLEHLAGQHWDENRYVGEHLIRAIGRLLAYRLPEGEVVPPKFAKAYPSPGATGSVETFGDDRAQVVNAAIELSEFWLRPDDDERGPRWAPDEHLVPYARIKRGRHK